MKPPADGSLFDRLRRSRPRPAVLLLILIVVVVLLTTWFVLTRVA